MSAAMHFESQYYPGVSYAVGDVVSSNDVLYLSTRDNNSGNSPATSPNAWTPVARALPTIEPLTALGSMEDRGELGTPTWFTTVIPYDAGAWVSTTMPSHTFFLTGVGSTSQLTGVRVGIRQAFAAPGLTALTVSLGDAPDSADYLGPISLLQANVGQQNISLSATGASVLVTLSATGANLNTLTAGELQVDICVLSTTQSS